MKYLKPVNKSGLAYRHIVGTGGIGSGMFFKLHGNATLGRNESRCGDVLPFKDYCKLHIITHYVSALLGAGIGKFEVFPIGKIGDDEAGAILYKEMEKMGMQMTGVEITTGYSTLFGVCFQYPDNTGGNITSANSASSRLNKKDISSFFDKFSKSSEYEIILAVPEIPVDARMKLLEIGRLRGSFNIASVASAEIKEFNEKDGFKNVDLIGLNIDEANSIASLAGKKISAHKTIDLCIEFLSGKNPEMMIVITEGAKGCYGYKDGHFEHVGVMDVEVKATAGAGDALLAGIISGICCGLSFLKGRSDNFFSETPLNSSLEFGSLLASIAVTSPDTINHKIDANYIKKFAVDNNVHFSKEFAKFF